MKNKTIPYSIFPILISILLFWSCSPDDNIDPESDEDINYEFQLEVYQYQMAQIQSETGVFAEPTYSGKIAERVIELIAISDSILVFDVGDIEPGTYPLEIAIGEGLFGELTVFETTLTAEPDVLINTLAEEIRKAADDIGDGSTDAEINIAVSNLLEIYNNASNEEKHLMASTYQANKKIFDDLLAGEDEFINGRETVICESDLCKFKASVFLLGTGGALVYLSGGNPYALVVGVPSILVGYSKAKKYFNAFKDSKIMILDLSINEISESLRNESDVSFKFDEPYLISISSIKRTVNNEDEESNNELLGEFFDNTESLNSISEKINAVIQFINDKIPFRNFDLVDPQNVPEVSDQESEDLSNDNFEDYSFDIDYDGINSTTTLNTEGKVELTVTADENMEVDGPIETELVINYNDDFNNFSSSFPITVIQDTINSISLVSDIPETANISKTIDDIAVRVLDQYNNPAEGVSITWEITEGGGSLISEDVTTNADGYAYASWEMGSQPAINQLLVRAFEDNEELDGGPITINVEGTLPDNYIQAPNGDYAAFYSSDERAVYDEEFGEYYLSIGNIDNNIDPEGIIYIGISSLTEKPTNGTYNDFFIIIYHPDLPLPRTYVKNLEDEGSITVTIEGEKATFLFEGEFENDDTGEYFGKIEGRRIIYDY